MKQECRIWYVWMAWAGIPGIALLLGLMVDWRAGLLTLIAGVAFQVAYVRWFPHLSRWVGYGSVADVPAPASTRAGVAGQVVLYTARGCSFCPIIRQRLAGLQGELGFELVARDVTFQPRWVAEKGIQSVPVTEAHGRYLVGNGTSAEILEFLRGAAG